jgi:hypothetical protein
MNVNVRAPIHAATAILTATVTAMSMIDATTGLRAFLHFNIFIFLSIPPFEVIEYVSGNREFKSYDLIHHINHLQNKTTKNQKQIFSLPSRKPSKMELYNNGGDVGFEDLDA